MKLKNSYKVIMRGKEGKPNPEKSIDIFRIAYFLLLFSLVAYIISYFILKQLVVKGEGFVIFNIVKVEAPFSGKIIDLNVSKNQYIKKGQFLCNIEERIKNNIPAIRQVSTKYTQAYYKLLDFKAQYESTKKIYTQYQKEFKKLELLRSLELYNPNETMYQNLKNKVNNLKMQLDTLKIKINTYKKLPLIIKNKTVNNIPFYSKIKYPIYSSVNGNLLQSIKENEVVKTGDIIFTIQTENDLRIEAYFSQKYIDELKKGDEVTIILPNEIEEKGYIADISINSIDLNFKTLQKLKLIIIPKNKNIKFWKKYSLLRLKVRKYKW